MALTLAYDDQLSRVRITADGLSDAAVARVERSTDEIRWTTVRGGSALRPSGGTIRLDDYEFVPNVVNHYRVTSPSVADAFGRVVSDGWGSTDTGQAWETAGGAVSDYSVSAGAGRMSLTNLNVSRRALLPGLVPDGEVLVRWTIPVDPTGDDIETTVMIRYQDSDNYLQASFYWDRESRPLELRVVRRQGGGVTDRGIVQLPFTPLGAGLSAWMRVRWSGPTIQVRAWPAAGVEPAAWSLTATDPTWQTGRVGLRANVQPAFTGALPVEVAAHSFALVSPTVEMSAQITPVITHPWIKSIARPFLSRRLPEVESVSPISRPARVGVFDVQGRSMPIAVSSVRGSRRWDLTVITQDPDEARTLDLILASGDVLYLQVPPGSNVPSGYVAVGDSAEQRFPGQGGKPDEPRRFVLPLTEVAPPGPDVVGATVTWQTVINTYATWADVIAAHDTWADLAELIGDPEDVIVP